MRVVVPEGCPSPLLACTHSPTQPLPPLPQIAAIDYSVLPPSIGIEIGGNYRETEATRLQPLSLSGDGAGGQQQEAEAVQGLGHRDAATEAKEAAAAALER